MKALRLRSGMLIAVAMFALVVAGGPSWARDPDPECSTVLERWERITHDLRVKLDELRNVQRTPMERMIDRPLIESGTNKSIARQVADALQVKDDLLKKIRKECRTLLDTENELFARAERCLEADTGSKKSEGKRLSKQRTAVIQNALAAIAEVREVEGKDSYTQYMDPWRGQSSWRGRPGANYWQVYPGY